MLIKGVRCYIIGGLRSGSRHAGRFVRVNAHKDVAAAQVVEVVGESADTVVNALGVPTLLELYAVGLNLLLIQQVGYVDR